jgi:hypothetical protein
MLGVLAAPAEGGDLPPQPSPSPIADTQVTLRIIPLQGRATVIAIDGPALTVVTAAHVLTPDDLGRFIHLRHRDRPLSGRVTAVWRNPGFHPVRSRSNPHERSADGTLGVDTAIAVIAIDLVGAADRRVFEQIRAADIAPQPIPGRSGQLVPVHIVDQNGEEHVLRAGNQLNPKSLAWGRRSFDTQRGDSGAGVFALARKAEGEPWPILIGVVSQTDDRGAIATVIHRHEPWIEEALAHTSARPK